MIEKFSKEELAIIREELKNLPRDHMKRDLCHDSFMRLRDAFKAQKEYDGIYGRELEDSIITLADYSLCNYEISPNAKGKNAGKYRRSIFVRNEFADEYSECVNEIIDVLIKHLRTEIIE